MLRLTRNRSYPTPQVSKGLLGQRSTQLLLGITLMLGKVYHQRTKYLHFVLFVIIVDLSTKQKLVFFDLTTLIPVLPTRYEVPSVTAPALGSHPHKDAVHLRIGLASHPFFIQ